jgi:meiotically up-regulated gene 157 (Mug157) protein
MTQKNIILGIVLLLAIIVVGLFFHPNIPGIIQSNTQDNTQDNTTGSEAKINIDQVCNDALAYMTFTDAASAEVFVNECKEGKHPEVIDQWKVQMGISNDAAI